ncbi:MAG: type II secretion system protein, partial [Planctomycetota bacterium]|nr:type II secretion system protein [Planctomycetota bacterium]
MNPKTSSATRDDLNPVRTANLAIAGPGRRGGSAPPRTGRRSGRGFSLVEVIIVIMVLSLFAGLILPRMSGIARSSGKLTVMKASDLLAAFAYRDSIASGRSALKYDGDSRVAMLMRDRSPSRAAGNPSWVPDSLAPHLYLPDDFELRAFVDGSLMPDGGWLIESSTDGTRPKIELEVTGDDVDSIVVLAPWAQSPYTNDRVEGLLKTI